jgi:hypothetical protein
VPRVKSPAAFKNQQVKSVSYAPLNEKEREGFFPETALS